MLILLITHKIKLIIHNKNNGIYLILFLISLSIVILTILQLM